MQNIKYKFFTRNGGVGSGIYKSLNCSLQSNDNPENLIKNRSIVLNDMGGDKLFTLKQIHSSICHVVGIDDDNEKIIEGDALITRDAGVVIGVLTADCAPVLMYGFDQNNKPIIAAVHAGWGGALKGVLDNTIAKMREIGAVTDSINAEIGACIGQQSYEVDAEFLTPFVTENEHAINFFKYGKIAGKYNFDLKGYVSWRLKRCGIDNVNISNHDTYVMNDEYFSFRRATHKGESDYGRQISVIMFI